MADNVNHPTHYAPAFLSRKIECIDITRHLPFDLGNAFKYVWRAGKKGGKEKAIEDLKKAEWYLNDVPDSNKSDTAVAIFSLLNRPGGDGLDELRYEVLEEIIYCNTSTAIRNIGKMIEEIENI